MVVPTCKELHDTNTRQQVELDSLHTKVNNIALQITSTATKDDLYSLKIEIENGFHAQLENFFSNRDLNNRHDAETNGSNSGGNHTGESQFHMHSGGISFPPPQRMPKVDFPRFDGDNPKSWLQKCEYYFQMHDLPDNTKTRMEAIHLDGKAFKWYDNFCLNQPHISWKFFCDNVCDRFENPANDNTVGFFNKLTQLTTVEAYFEEFEYLKALLLSVRPHFPESYFIASFTGGLKEELRISKATKPPQKLFNPNFSTSKPFTPTTCTPKPSVVPSTSLNPQPLPKINAPISLKRLTPKQVQARKSKSLCFNCDDYYRRGHICKKKYLCVLIGEETAESSEPEGELQLDTEEAPAVESDMEISLHALTGTISTDTIRILGSINKKNISILIETGSTNSFIDSALAKELKCPVEQTASLLVTVENGDKTIISGICSQLTWSMQGHKFCGDLRLLPLGGCDIVLGADWLRNLGDVLFNLSKLCITLKYKGKKITLTRVQHKPSLSMMSGSAMKKFFQKHTHGLVGQLFSISSSTTNSTTPPQISSLLNQYPDKTVVENLVKEMLQSGIIQPSNIPFTSPILLVKKKDNSWRFCVDYRKLNSLTIKDKFPIPIIDELLDELHGSKFFTKIDLKSGYHQIRVHPSDIHKTTFRTHHGHFEFQVMPFGLTNAPATFQSLMNIIFQDHLRKFILVFFDDILIYNPTLESHLLYLQTTLEILRNNNLSANFSKCSFGQQNIEYLGHIITATGVMADPAKISAMVDWPIPTNIKALRGFLGLTGYYRKFVKNYGIVSRPLTELLKKDAFLWSPAATTAFNALKTAMKTTHVLALPDFNKQFTLEIDACDSGIRVVLMQENRSIAFYNKPLGPRVAALSTYEKELLAIVQAVTRWKQYLQGQKFIIKTDHQSIHYFLEHKISIVLQQKWFMKLLGFDYAILYKKGSDNKVADALSRRHHDSAHCHSITSSQPTWTQDIIASYIADPKVQHLITLLSLTPDAPTKYSYTDGLLRYIICGHVC
ncbi:uncharacterized protein LOC113294848 [Papaver somniferum]|uniref:uncharacterized protein LOC113294848 n=1 Tax=Papaver somniferum TaxID=3469 RepID=UPI000E703896|nr:uncharacterized protein LOC113294848 [Papaver somniferum]